MTEDSLTRREFAKLGTAGFVASLLPGNVARGQNAEAPTAEKSETGWPAATVVLLGGGSTLREGTHVPLEELRQSLKLKLSDKVLDPSGLLREMIKRARNHPPKVEIITCASAYVANETGEETSHILKMLGAGEVNYARFPANRAYPQMEDITQKRNDLQQALSLTPLSKETEEKQNDKLLEAERKKWRDEVVATRAAILAQPAIKKRVKEADIVWLDGGNQLRLAKILEKSGIDALITERLGKSDFVLGGNSAGVAVMAPKNSMIYDDINKYGMQNGADFLPFSGGIDMHLFDENKNDRAARLLQATLKNPGGLGIGLAKHGGCIIQAGKAEVFGAGEVVLARDGEELGRYKKGEVIDLSPWVQMAKTPAKSLPEKPASAPGR
jgi:cyanophycinase-like exopeptidase